MTEWHLPPDYILDNWTDELFDLMVEKLVERKKRESQAMQRTGDEGGHVISNEAFFAQNRHLIKVVKK